MKRIFRLFCLFLANSVVFGQGVPWLNPVSKPYKNERFATNLYQIEDSTPQETEFSPDYRWKDDHEKERNIAMAASAASLIGVLYTATRAMEARSRAEEKYDEYQSLTVGTPEEEFERVKKEHNDFREDGNFYSVLSAGFGAFSLVGLGFAIYWSF